MDSVPALWLSALQISVFLMKKATFQPRLSHSKHGTITLRAGHLVITSALISISSTLHQLDPPTIYPCTQYVKVTCFGCCAAVQGW
jgi:hypothetical protein